MLASLGCDDEPSGPIENVNEIVQVAPTEGMQACESDEECVVVRDTCCSTCGPGDTFIAVNTSSREAYLAMRCGARQACLDCGPVEPTGTAGCVSNLCTYRP